jgi:hypothetical protein
MPGTIAFIDFEGVEHLVEDGEIAIRDARGFEAP